MSKAPIGSKILGCKVKATHGRTLVSRGLSLLFKVNVKSTDGKIDDPTQPDEYGCKDFSPFARFGSY